MRRFLLVMVVALMPAMRMNAVPAYPYKKSVKLADGTVQTLTLRGDEFFSYYTTEAGERVKLLQDGTLLRLTDDDFAALRENRAAAIRRVQGTKKSAEKRRATYIGEKKGLVILVNFQDNEFTAGSREVYQDFFNKAGYTEYGMTGSVSDYFNKQSYGNFKLDFDVVGPYTLKYKMSYYGAANGDSHDINPRKMVEEAVKMADEEVNYADYDWDGDGEVEQVFIVYAGYGENYGADPNCIWPHKSQLSTELELDKTKISVYACTCELRGVSGQSLEGIGTACHEFSHCLGLSDHYDTAGGDNFGMGTWDILCSGSYNNACRTPAAYTSYERMFCGWLEPTPVKSETDIKEMQPLTQRPEAYILYNEANKNEYYLLENRQQEGFDAALDGHGLLVVHVDYNEGSWAGNSVNSGSPQRMTIIAADDDYTVSARSLAADPFPGTLGVTSLTDYTTPAATLNNRNKNGKYLMNIPIEDIRESEDGTISMLVGAKLLETPRPTASGDVTATSFTLTWEPVSGATGYELQMTDMAAKKPASEAVVLDEDFKKCYSASVGFADISSKLSQYTSTPGFSGSKLFQTPNLLRIGTSTASGELRTPVMDAASTGNLTVLMTVKPMKEGTKVKGTMYIVTDVNTANQEVPFEFSTATTLVLHSTELFSSIYRVDIRPETGMYIQHLTLYDGDYSQEELGLGAETKEAVKAAPAKRRVNVKTFTTTEPRFTFTELSNKNEYRVSVRAVNSRQQSSWSDEISVLLEGAAILPIEATSPAKSETLYDLMGRPVYQERPTPGIYIRNGKKFILR